MIRREFIGRAVRQVRLLSFLSATAVALTTVAGCPGSNTASTDSGASSTGARASSGKTASGTGELVIEGSETLQELSQKWVEEFKKQNPDVNITVTGGGSGQGIKSLINGTATIANASREVTEKEREQAKASGAELVETSVARDGITIVVNPSNNVTSLTLQQVSDLYTGKVKNWKEVGGPDLSVTASGRESSSGTYKYFQEDVLDKQEYRADMKSLASPNAIAESVTTEKGGVGYIGVAQAAQFTKAGKVKEVSIAFKAGEAPVMPTSEAILAGKYPISRALYNYTKGQPEGTAKAYLDFVTGPEGQKIVEEIGFVRLGDAQTAGAPAK